MRTKVASAEAVTDQFSKRGAINTGLLLCAVMLALVGLVMITSASLDIAQHRNDDALFYFVRHSIYLIAGFTAAFVVWITPIAVWQRYATLILLAGFISLIVIFIPGVGHTANSATRWLALGPVTLQVSEFAKLGVLVYLASYLVRQHELVRSHILGFINPMIVIVLLVALLLEQPDFGAVVVILSAALGMLFLGGVRIWEFTLLVIVAVLAMALIIFAEDYRVARLTAYLNPWEYSQGGGYQLVQSLIAFGRGEWFGLGLGNSIQKLFFLPEAHTDFVFAVLAEELGFIGCLSVLALYSFMVVAIFRVAHRAEQLGQGFSAYLAYGIALVFSVQLFINVGVNTGLLPTKGLTLPFISYGGSSLLISSVFIALVLRIDRELNQSFAQLQSRKGGVVNVSTSQSAELRGAHG